MNKYNSDGSLTLDYAIYRTNHNIYASKSRVNKKFAFQYDYFITFTFDPSKIDSNDIEVVSSCVQSFGKSLKNKTRYNDFNYRVLLLPDFKSSSQGIHFHGLLYSTDYKPFKLVYSGLKDKNGKDIYNLTLWSLGYTTAVAFDGNSKGFTYIKKYITKYSEKLLKHRYYYYSNIKK